MKIGILGTGGVGRTLGTKLASLGHEVKLGSRTADNAEAAKWAAATGGKGTHGTFADAAKHGEIVLNCTSGKGAVAAVESAGADNLAGKVLIDVSNPLDFSRGMPPALSVTGWDSLAEQVQRAAPKAHVVKALNTCAADVMIDPGRVKSAHELLIAGNDAGAKEAVKKHLGEWFGWKGFVDLGDLSAARASEAWVLLWVRIYGAIGTSDFGLHIAR